MTRERPINLLRRLFGALGVPIAAGAAGVAIYFACIPVSPENTLSWANSAPAIACMLLLSFCDLVVVQGVLQRPDPVVHNAAMRNRVGVCLLVVGILAWTTTIGFGVLWQGVLQAYSDRRLWPRHGYAVMFAFLLSSPAAWVVWLGSTLIRSRASAAVASITCWVLLTTTIGLAGTLAVYLSAPVVGWSWLFGIRRGSGVSIQLGVLLLTPALLSLSILQYMHSSQSGRRELAPGLWLRRLLCATAALVGFLATMVPLLDVTIALARNVPSSRYYWGVDNMFLLVGAMTFGHTQLVLALHPHLLASSTAKKSGETH